MSSYEPLTIRAHLATGIAQAAPWGIALDGLLAAELWAEHKHHCRSAGQPYTRAMEDPNPPDLALPLARCTPPGGPWHWASTCAYPEPLEGHTHDVQTWTGRTDPRALEQISSYLPKTVSPKQGRYRVHHMPLLVTITPNVTWHAIGDPARITELLTPLRTIGKKHTNGHGQVLRWEITPAQHLDTFTAAHLHPNNTLGRPTPDNCLIGHENITTGGRGTAGIRPPYIHTARQEHLHLPALLDQDPAA